MITESEAAVREALAELREADLATLAEAGLPPAAETVDHPGSSDVICCCLGILGPSGPQDHLTSVAVRPGQSTLEVTDRMPNYPTPPDTSKLLDRSGAAEFLRQSVTSIDRQRRDGKLPHYRLPNGRVMFPGHGPGATQETHTTEALRRSLPPP